MKKFHRHDWVIFTAETPFKIERNTDKIIFKKKMGATIICSKCGKTNKRLSKTYSKIIANTKRNSYDDMMSGIIKTYVPPYEN